MDFVTKHLETVKTETQPDSESLHQQLETTQRELRHKALLLSAALAENKVVRRNVTLLRLENQHLLKTLSTFGAGGALL